MSHCDTICVRTDQILHAVYNYTSVESGTSVIIKCLSICWCFGGSMILTISSFMQREESQVNMFPFICFICFNRFLPPWRYLCRTLAFISCLPLFEKLKPISQHGSCLVKLNTIPVPSGDGINMKTKKSRSPHQAIFA